MDSLNLKQKITLVSFEVDYYDRREVKPRTLRHERLGTRPAAWIVQQYEGMGYAVQQVKRGQSMDVQVDLSALWRKTAAEKARRQKWKLFEMKLVFFKRVFKTAVVCRHLNCTTSLFAS